MWNFKSHVLFIWSVLPQLAPVPSAQVPSPLYIFLIEQNLLRCCHENVLAVPTWKHAYLFCPPHMLTWLSYSTSFFVIGLWLHFIFPTRWIISWALAVWLIVVPLQPPGSTGYSVHSESSKNATPLDAKESSTDKYWIISACS